MTSGLSSALEVCRDALYKSAFTLLYFSETYGRFRHQQRMQLRLGLDVSGVEMIEEFLKQVPVFDCQTCSINVL